MRKTIIALWRGEIYLTNTFWVYGVAVYLVLLISMGAYIMYLFYRVSPEALFSGLNRDILIRDLTIFAESHSLKVSLFPALLMSHLSTVHRLLIFPCIWRSANRYLGPAIWKYLAKIIAAITPFFFVLSVLGKVNKILFG